MLHLKTIDADNWRPNLKVAPSQAGFVSDSYGLLARAYAFRDYRSKAYLICDDETPVGMSLYYDCDSLDAYDFSQLFIDERYQGRGYGTTATRMILDEMRRDGKYQKVVLCYIESNKEAKRLYQKFGFRETDRDEDEIIMGLQL